MAEYKMNGGKILIVPGYTAEEQLELQNSKDSEGASTDIAEPKGVYLECQSVEYHPHIKNYEEFESAQGLILTEKACDYYAELTVTFVVHQSMTNILGNMEMDDVSQEIEMNVSVYDPNPDTDIGKNKELMNAYVDPSNFTEDFIKLRYEFLKRFDGRPLSIVSPLFPPMVAAYLTECTYTIESGEEVAVYSAVFREVLNVGL